ncbi:MAG: sigma-70 family RNA polymerase sigma factor [Candidatus Omnitrophica bacterium]|nr:sigma-70 family RNA polymerase sigma factor [Candidatus Omnitrophota bacterium]
MVKSAIMITEELLKKCVQKDRSAWEKFAVSSSTLVLKSIKYKLKKLGVRSSKNIVQDISQEVFLSIWEKNKLSKIDDIRCLKGWLAIVSINTTSNYCRKNVFNEDQKTLSLDKYLSPDDYSLKYKDVLPSGARDLDKILEENEFKVNLEKELAELSSKQKLILKLNLYNGKTHKDIGNIMNIPEGTVSAIISRIRKKLKKNLQGFS